MSSSQENYLGIECLHVVHRLNLDDTLSSEFYSVQQNKCVGGLCIRDRFVFA